MYTVMIKPSKGTITCTSVNWKQTYGNWDKPYTGESKKANQLLPWSNIYTAANQVYRGINSKV